MSPKPTRRSWQCARRPSLPDTSDTIAVAERSLSSQHVRSASWCRRRDPVPDQGGHCRRRRSSPGSMLGDRLYQIRRIRLPLPREVFLHSTFEARHGVAVDVQLPIKAGVADVDAEAPAACSEAVSIGYVRCKFQLLREILLYSTFEARHGYAVDVQLPIGVRFPRLRSRTLC